MNRLISLVLAMLLICSVPVIGRAANAKPEYSEITVEVFDRGTDDGRTDPTNNYYTDWIKAKALEDLNIGVSFVAVSRWEETEQLNHRMAAGTAPDLCVTYSNELIANYRELGGIVDLAPYIDTLLPDLKAFLGPDLSLPGRDLIERNKVMETGAVRTATTPATCATCRPTCPAPSWCPWTASPTRTASPASSPTTRRA